MLLFGRNIKKVPRKALFLFLLQMFDEEIGNAGQQMLGGISATDAVVTVGVDVHVELFVGLYKGFAIF